jgi:CHAT domain
MESFKLELVRPGPLHGQLLSKLTYYVGLCDGVDAETVRFPFDHNELKSDLESLRYYIGGRGAERVPNSLRAGSVERLGARIADVFASMRGFQTRIAKSCAGGSRHLRLVLGGSELSLVPFELSSIPEGWPGSGSKFALHTEAPIITRELRDSSRLKVEWNREPRILFCSASPTGFQPPPTQAHLVAITSALHDWVEGARNGLTIGQVVTVLEQASIDSIRDAVARAFEEGRPYTHVHLLCHGCELLDQPGRYGVALCRLRHPEEVEIVDGPALLRALTCGIEARLPPTMVVLASCDSANAGTVEVAGASVAYELHQGGVPWVFASQLPLTYTGSAVLARMLYHGLLRGLDPRLVLKQTRIELARDSRSHDWGSIVAFAAFPANFEDQVREFCVRQMRELIRSALGRLQSQWEVSTILQPAARDEEFDAIAGCLRRWKEALSSLPESAGEWSEYFGVEAATYKQQSEFANELATGLLRKALASYRKAAELTLTNHWAVTQALALCILLKEPTPDGWFELASAAARFTIDKSPRDKSGRETIWSYGTLLELAVLHETGTVAGRGVREWAQEFVDAFNHNAGQESFGLFSTRRQLRRYTVGQFALYSTPAMKQRAEEALSVLANAEEA